MSSRLIFLLTLTMVFAVENINCQQMREIKRIYSLLEVRNLGERYNRTLAHHKSTGDESLIANPCYLKGYTNSGKNMKGVGDFEKCYELLSVILNKDQNKTAALKPDTSSSQALNKSIVLGKDFQEIGDYIMKERITLGKLKDEAINVCKMEYTAFSERFKNSFDDICFKLTYTLILVENLFGVKNSDNSNLMLILSVKEIDSAAENEILLNNFYMELKHLPQWLVISFLVLSSVFLVTYLLSAKIASYLESHAFREIVDFKHIDHELLESTMISFPVKYFLLTTFKEKIAKRIGDNVLDLKEYKELFSELYDQNENFQQKINDTLIMRNQLKASIILSIFHIILLIILSILTTKIISNAHIANKSTHGTIMIVFSVFYMSLLILECLKLISSIDRKKYFYSKFLNSGDKKLLECEYDDMDNQFHRDSFITRT